MLPRILGSLERVSQIPPSLQIEPTNNCNLRCICCSTSRSGRKKGCMDMALYQRIANEAASIGVKRFHLYLHGEPFLHPEILNMVASAKRHGIAVHLTTNGMLMDRAKLERLLDSGVTCADHVIFSLLGQTRETHEKIMRRVDHNQVVNNIHALLELRKTKRVNGPIVETILYKMPENEHEEEAFFTYWRRFVDHVRIVGRVSKSFSDFGSETVRVPVRTRTCSNLWERMTIFWNGDVTLCCNDVGGDHVLGNLSDSTISEIWNGTKLEAVRRLHRSRQLQKIPFCYRCDM